MDYDAAVRLVADDVRRSYPELSDHDAVEHVCDSMRLPEEPFVHGAYPLDDDGTELATAYRVVLTRRSVDDARARSEALDALYDSALPLDAAGAWIRASIDRERAAAADGDER